MAQTLRKPVVLPGSRLTPTWLARIRRFGPVQPYLYLLPALIVLSIWIYRPMIETLELSFYQWNLLPTRPKVFVGIENYLRILTLPEMGIALRNTAIYITGLLPVSVIIPLALAIAVGDITGRMRGIYRAILFTPVLVAPVVVAVIWRWMLHPLQGVVSTFMKNGLGIEPINWFRDVNWAIWAIIAITGWKLIGFSFLIFSAGLTNISRDYYEAAAIDGASRWNQIRHITLPLLTPTISFMVMMTILLGAQWVFPLINVLTQGGPLDATTNVYYLLWQFGFRTFNIGWSSAAAVLFFLAFGLLAWLLIRLIDRYSIYET